MGVSQSVAILHLWGSGGWGSEGYVCDCVFNTK